MHPVFWGKFEARKGRDKTFKLSTQPLTIMEGTRWKEAPRA